MMLNQIVKRIIPLFLFGGLFFAACSRAEPKIAFGFMELVYYQEEGGPRERLSFFIIPEDDDGLENISELYLYHDREGLRWIITPDDWVRFQGEGNQEWVGSRSVSMTDDENLPRGQYRAVLVNKGGEKSERLFSFDVPAEPRYPFPNFTVDGGRYRIDSRYPAHNFICYDSQGNIVNTVTAENREGLIEDLRLANTIRALALWAEDREYHTSALTNAVSVQ